MDIIKKSLLLRKRKKSKNLENGYEEENFLGIRKSKIVCILLTFVILGFSIIQPAGDFLFPAETIYALPSALYKPVAIGSLILSLLTGSGTATIPTGSIGAGSNIADVAIAMDSEAFTIENLIDNGVISIGSSGGTEYVAGWDPGAFNTLVSEEGLSTAYQAANVDDYLKTAVSTGAETAPFSGNLVLAMLANHIIHKYDGVVAMQQQILSPEEFADWYAKFQEDPNDPLYSGLKWIDEHTSKILNFDNFKNSFFSLFGTKIDKGVPITTSNDVMQYLRNYNIISYNLSGGSNSIYVYANDYPMAYYKKKVNNNTEVYLYACNPTNSSITWYIRRLLVNPTTLNKSISSKGISNSFFSDGTVNVVGGVEFTNQAECENYLRTFINGQTLPNVYSTDVINSEGNLNGTQDQPATLQEGKQIAPITGSDYQSWADDAQELTNQGNYDDNGAIFTNFANPYITDVSDNPTVNFPTPDYTDPTYNPSDITPDQPTVPEKPELTPEEQQEVISGSAVDLQNIFPFCIPFDIVDFINIINVQERKAPDIIIPVESELFDIHEEIEIDMSIFDDVAFLLRNLELITFIISLAVVTRYLIGAR